MRPLMLVTVKTARPCRLLPSSALLDGVVIENELGMLTSSFAIR
jgi:hypothetical protein